MKKLMLGSITLILTAIIFITSQTSCKKETIKETDAALECTQSIKGLWVGTYSVNSIPAQGQLFIGLSVYPDGTILYKSKGGDGNFYYSQGAWSLSTDNIFSATVTSFVTPNSGSPVTQSITAKYTIGTLTDAVWSDTNNPNGTPQSGNIISLSKVY